jgi:hypothetical protein
VQHKSIGSLAFWSTALIASAFIVLYSFVPRTSIALILVILMVLSISFVVPTSFHALRVVYSFSAFCSLWIAYLLMKGLINPVSLSKLDLILVCVGILIGTLLIHQRMSTHGLTVDNPYSRRLLAASAASVFVTATSASLFRDGVGKFVAWVSSGDSRNQVQFAYDLAANGYLTLESLRIPYVPASLSAFLNAGTSSNLNNDSSQRLSTDLVAYTYTWMILIAVLGFAFAGIWEMFIPKSNLRNPAVYLMIAAGSVLATRPFTLSAFITDGMVTAIAGSIALSAGIALSLDSSLQGKLPYLILSMFILFYSFTSWVLIILPVTLILLPRMYRSFVDAASRKTLIYRICALLAFIVFVCVFLFDPFRGEVRQTLVVDGSINPPDLRIFYLFALILLINSLLSFSDVDRIRSTSLLALVAVAGTTLSLKLLAGIGPMEWNYYTKKFVLISAIAILPLVLISIPYFGLRAFANSRFKYYRQFGMLVVAILAVSILLKIASPRPNIWTEVASGWGNPSAKTISKVLAIPNDPSNPSVMFFANPDEPGETRPGNFWLATYVVPNQPFWSWAYVNDGESNIEEFCILNKSYPKMRVVTSSEQLEKDFGYKCPAEEIDVLLTTP